ncbi:MAG: AAA family ATPase [Chitinivibrionales bacterium]|nr:AAA family ATPase [Chitinivibrionales bacterium]
MPYYKRDLEACISSYLRSPGDQIALISGARQTGKSTLIENLRCDKEKVIINLWDEERETLAVRHAATFSEFQHILQTVFRFIPDGSRILVIDEAQASENLCSFIMEMQRKWKGQKVVLLGSLLANLFQKGKPQPVGRTIEFICRPLNFREFLRFRDKEDYLGMVTGHDRYSEEIHNLLMDEYRIFLQIGGLPGVVTADKDGQSLILMYESLLNNLYRDADRFIGSIQESKHYRVPQYGRIMEIALSSIAHHLAFPTQNTTLLSSNSPAYRTVLPLVLEALWAWHLAYTLSFATAQVTSKKGYSSKKYLFDTGIANFLLTRGMPVQFGGKDQTPAMLLENAVLQDCISFVESVKAIQCYRSSNKVTTELDFVVRYKEKTIPLEVKSSTKVKHSTINQFIDFIQRSGISMGYVVYTGMPETEEIAGKRITYIPPYLIASLF